VALVDLMIVGGAKAGSTSLLVYLAQHPGVQRPEQIEMTWFSDPALHAKPFPEDLYYDGPAGDRLRLGKLAGLMYRDHSIDWLYDTNPAVHAVAILRDPVKRAYSDFWFGRRQGREPIEDFAAAIKAAETAEPESPRWQYLEGGRYYSRIEKLQQRFGRDQVHAVIFEDYIADPATTVAPVARAIGLDPSPLGSVAPRENPAMEARSGTLARARRRRGVVQFARRALPSGTRGALRKQYRRLNERETTTPPLDPDVEGDLRAHFAESNRRLEALLGHSIESWPRA
jgi:hypothetical protein